MAAGKAFNKLNAVISVGADRNWIVHCVAVRRTLDTKARAQFVHQLKASGHCTTECAAHSDMGLARRVLPKHRVEGDQLENIDRLQAELFRDPQHSLVANEPEKFLPQMQQWHGRASLVSARIASDRLID